MSKYRRSNKAVSVIEQLAGSTNEDETIDDDKKYIGDWRARNKVGLAMRHFSSKWK